ncbi:hypothetical protein M9979_12190 [Sphingomonas sp. RP10(2022)]|uniref:Uncharacterized protein n=1 Tax=Sphingomonas liriopis TaxID=2949094 RepID=A0A9X2HXZ1_9SPHN|nr:hypothetical protein [Sphingomonas liriopis]MCP3735633.1 hypothetical protein [Sphingomonas liriopis]
MMSIEEIQRQRALELAVEGRSASERIDETVKRAEAYLRFLRSPAGEAA